jgi:hypothetical protein
LYVNRDTFTIQVHLKGNCFCRDQLDRWIKVELATAIGPNFWVGALGLRQGVIWIFKLVGSKGTWDFFGQPVGDAVVAVGGIGVEG